MYVHTRSVADRLFEVWRSPGRFTKNPDIVRLSSGRLLLIYSDNDAHWSQENQILTLLASDDDGITWFKHREVARHDLDKGEGRFMTPRLSLLADGRVVVLIDQDDYSHFHEEQPPGNLAFWSSDNGDTWSDAQETGIKGFEPDRVMDLPDGRLGVASQLMRGETMEYAEILSCSDDGGQTWYEQSTIAYDGYHRFCEGAIVILEGGDLACVLRESHNTGIPSFVTFSSDVGKTWSTPQMMPFATHRPYAKQLSDGRVLITGRHVNGGLGTYAWCGDLRSEAGKWQVGGPRKEHTADLTDEALIIKNGLGYECRYSLLPPESSQSEVLLEGTLRVEGPEDDPVAFLSVAGLIPEGAVVEVAPNGITLATGKHDSLVPVDMTRERAVSIYHRRGMLEAKVDGETLVRYRVRREGQILADPFGADPSKRTQFGQLGELGQSFWKRVSYSVKNPTLENIEWSWDASDGVRPDEYQRTRMVQIHANDPEQKPNPDHGYTSWLHLDDGRILLVDYTNRGDQPGQSHLVGVHFTEDDIS